MEINKLLIFHMDLNYVNLRVDYMKKWLSRIAAMGYNAVLWEIEDKIEWDLCSDCVWPEAMSKKEFQDLLLFSRNLGLEPIPLLQTIGHGEYILQHRNYAHLRELPDHHDCYCTSNPEVRTFLKSWISEYLEVFGDINYFHLGGDEAYVFGKCPTCNAYSQKHGKNKLYANHILDIAEELLAKNIRPGIWCDMILHYPDKVGDIPKEFLIWDWNYWSNDQSTTNARLWGKGLVNKESVTDEDLNNIPELMDQHGNFVPFYTSDMLKRLGYSVVLCSAARSSGDTFFCPSFDIHAGNITGAARKTVTSDLLGNCVTSWAIRMSNYETQELLLKLAPETMKQPDQSTEQLIHNTAKEMFNQDPADLIIALKKVSEGFFFAKAHSTGVQWNGLKDSLTPPNDYIKNAITKWKSDNSWQHFGKDHLRIVKDIQDGISLLNQFIEKSSKSFEFLETWSTAAHLQLWQAYIAQQLFAEQYTIELKQLVCQIKENAINFFKRWETVQSAEKNATLIFDCLIDYINDQLEE